MQITVLSQVVFKKGGIPTNTPHGFHVEATWKRSFPSRFNVESTWCVSSSEKGFQSNFKF